MLTTSSLQETRKLKKLFCLLWKNSLKKMKRRFYMYVKQATGSRWQDFVYSHIGLTGLNIL